MGLIDWIYQQATSFKRLSRQPVATDVVWLNRQARNDGLAVRVAELRQHHDPQRFVILTAHFAEGLAELRPIVDAVGNPAAADAALASDLPRLTGDWRSDPSWSVEILVLERHPLCERDDSILKFASTLPGRSRVTFYLALDDPLLRTFSSEWVRTVLQQLGMREDEPLESKMVSRRLRAAQKKFAIRMGRELPASSSDEWLRLNTPSAE